MSADAAPGADVAIRSNLDALVARSLDCQRAALPGLFDAIQPDALQHVIQDTRFHFEFLAAALRSTCPPFFQDYIVWTMLLFESRRLPLSWIACGLDCGREALRAVLSDADYETAAGYLEMGRARLAQPVSPAASALRPDQPHAALALRYLAAILAGNRLGAIRLVVDAADQGVPVAELYRWVFQETQREIGRRWHAGEIGVSHEHLATAVTQLAMAQLYPRIIETPRIGRVLVAAAVGRELHDLPIRLVADHFEMAGWDTHYLGGNVPPAEVAFAASERRAHVVALSATLPTHVDAVAAAVAAVRAHPSAREARVIVGGYPFNVSPGLWAEIGADGSAPDAASAVALATRLVDAG